MATLERIRMRDQGLCVVCHNAGRVTLGRVVDHIVPLWAGGHEADSNRQLICDECHDEKSKYEAALRWGGM